MRATIIPLLLFCAALVLFFPFDQDDATSSDTTINPALAAEIIARGEQVQSILPENYSPLQRVFRAIAPATRWVRHKISRGDTLAQIWDRYTARRGEAQQAAVALAKIGAESRLLRSGEDIELEISDDNIETLRKRDSSGRVIVLERKDSSGFNARVLEPQIIEERRVVTGIIQSSFSAAATNSGVSYDVVDDFVDLFGARVEFQRNLQPGDSYSIEYTDRRTSDGVELSPGPILNASLKTGGKLLAALRHAGTDGKPYYFDESGNALGNYFLRYPLKFTRISSTFTTSRFHPVLNIRRPHNGVDFAAPTGTPVRAVADGVVQKAGWTTTGGGNAVMISHGDRWSTAYLHLSKISPKLKKGMRVSRGEVIGNVGMTGLATGPHLHFSLFDRGTYVNPLSTKLPQMSTVRSLPKDYLLAQLSELESHHQGLQQVAARKSAPPAAAPIG